jgi:hypothetical protein
VLARRAAGRSPPSSRRRPPPGPRRRRGRTARPGRRPQAAGVLFPGQRQQLAAQEFDEPGSGGRRLAGGRVQFPAQRVRDPGQPIYQPVVEGVLRRGPGGTYADRHLAFNDRPRKVSQATHDDQSSISCPGTSTSLLIAAVTVSHALTVLTNRLAPGTTRAHGDGIQRHCRRLDVLTQPGQTVSTSRVPIPVVPPRHADHTATECRI